MALRVVIIGLGPGRPEQVTREAWDVLGQARILYLRTARHPAVPHLPVHLELRPLEDGPDAGLSSADIVARLLQDAGRPLYYGVPGHPWVDEPTTRLLWQQLGAGEVRIVAGLSFLEPVCAALGLDPLERGLLLCAAGDLAAGDSPFDPPVPLDPTRPLLVAHLQGPVPAARVRRALQEHYPAGHLVTVVWTDGFPGEEPPVSGALDELEGWVGERAGTLYVPPISRPQAQREAATLEWVCARLRGPGGCPWDREQDHASLRRNLLEEAYETLEALDVGDLPRLCEELGDLLMQIYLHAQLAREEGAFRMADVVAGITAKLIRRHPHVFGEVQVAGSAEVLRNWEAIKALERAAGGRSGASLLAGVPRTLPALAYAQEVGDRASRVRFDWTRVEDVWAKVDEELAELRAATLPEEQAEEMGDVLFALVNLARWLGIAAEDALRATGVKFARRFASIEEAARRRGLSFEELSMAEMDALWEAAKAAER